MASSKSDIEVTHVANLEDAIDLLKTKIATANFGGNTLEDPNNTRVYVRTLAILKDPPHPFVEASAERRVYYGEGTVSVTGRQIIIEQKRGVEPRTMKIIVGASKTPVENVSETIKAAMQAIADRLEMKMLTKFEDIRSSHVSGRLYLTFKTQEAKGNKPRVHYRVVSWHDDERISEGDIAKLAKIYAFLLLRWKNGKLEDEMQEACRRQLKIALLQIRENLPSRYRLPEDADKQITLNLKSSKRDTNIWHLATSWHALGDYGDPVCYEVKGSVELSLTGDLSIDVDRIAIENKFKRSQKLERVVQKEGFRVSGPLMTLACQSETMRSALIEFIENKPKEKYALVKNDESVGRLIVKRGLIAYEGSISQTAYLSRDAIVIRQALPQSVVINLIGKGLDALVEDKAWRKDVIKSAKIHSNVTTIDLKKRHIAVTEALAELTSRGHPEGRFQMD